MKNFDGEVWSESVRRPVAGGASPSINGIAAATSSPPQLKQAAVGLGISATTADRPWAYTLAWLQREMDFD